jgi:Zn-dependent protease with chaperone function
MTRFQWTVGVVGIAGIALVFTLLQQQQKNVAQQIQQATQEGIRQGVHDGVRESLDQVKNLPAETLQDARDALFGETRDKELPVDKTRSHDPVESLFNFGEHLAKSADDLAQQVLRLSPEECRQVGERTHRLVIADHAELDSPKWQNRLKRLAQPIMVLHGLGPDDVHFTVLDSATVNAFSHVGNYVYVNRGLLELITLDDELQFILGHELGHIILGHCDRQATYSARAVQLAGDIGQLAQLAYAAIAVGYSEDQEFAADAWSFRNLQKLGRPRAAASAALERLRIATEAPDATPKPTQSQGILDRTLQQIDKHFRSHPPTTERIERLSRVGL